MNINNFIKEFNLDFSQPFIPNGFTEAKIVTIDETYKYLNIRIGNRDVYFDLATGKSIAAGAGINNGVIWEINKRGK
jgi:hypothetical protein